ncbi:hypothetical protein B0H99_107107 [Planomicrobium soli]|uniref:Uncharacterized protein n=1 Tax=Planomicrobium soli TaxID=1176648 RepID=A0A2P8GQN0_9BACL|nr:hypothetical protein [Planomicrobium soli]PSL36286.1 hypothetical protein B0H99_107107 [Planomicrobium soli]
MKKILSSQWKISGYALLSFIGGIIGGLLVNPSIYVVLGCLTALILLVFANIIYVLFKNNKKSENIERGKQEP